MLVHVEDFNIYADGDAGTSQMLQGLWAAKGGLAYIQSSPDVNDVGVKTLRVFGGTGYYMRFALPGAIRSAVGMAAEVWFENLPQSLVTNENVGFLFRVSDTNNLGQIALVVNPTGQLLIVRQNPVTVIATSDPVITANAFHHIEMLWEGGNNVGNVEVRVNGFTVINFAGDSQGQDGNDVGSVSYGSLGDVFYKKVVIWDKAGIHNNDFLGEVFVETVPLTGDVAMPWNPSTGTAGAPLISEMPFSDEEFITAATPPPGPAEFAMTDLPADIVSVKGVVVFTRMRKTDGGNGTVRVDLKRAGGTANGVDRPITTAFTFWRDVFETDPVTGNPMTPANFNAATLTVTRTA